MSNTRQTSEPIAITGLACRFPGGVDSLHTFEKLLFEGKSGITLVPADRWDSAAFFHPEAGRRGKINAPYGGFIENPFDFDAAFFGISPREALRMDPQHRLLLETAWNAFESAGLGRSELAASNTGVYVGVSSHDYRALIGDDMRVYDTYVATGNIHAHAAGRLSYSFDLRGPCMVLDTACSSSLVSLHLACNALRMKECTQALAGGVNLILDPGQFVMTASGKVLAPDGRCKAFDAAADGFVRAEGCGVLILETLDQARANGRPIYAIIRASGINQDGRTLAPTAPSVLAQRDLILQTLQRAGLKSSDLGYIETHGTGTALGDPIEIEALSAACDKGPECILGAVKTNLGHLETAAGVAGVIKAVLCLREGKIPPNLNFKRLNPMAEPADRFCFPTQQRNWPAGYKRRFAGISSFGMSGTNAHVIVEAEETAHDGQVNAFILPFSACDRRALHVRATQLAELVNHVDLYDLCWSNAVHGPRHSERMVVVASDREELIKRLTSNDPTPGVFMGAGKATDRILFVFSGQGSQWHGMGLELYALEAVFAETFDACDDITDRPGQLRQALEDPGASLDNTELAQPLLVAIQLGLVELLASWGVEPAAVLGHSVGEISAAAASGALSLEEAMRLAARRGRLMQAQAGKGGMIQVSAEPEIVAKRLESLQETLAMAAINGPSHVVLAGNHQALDAFEAQNSDLVCRRLRVSYAFHGPDMREPSSLLMQWPVQAVEPAIPFYSSVEGDLLGERLLDAEYWACNTAGVVNFDGAFTAALASGYRTIVEIGPHPVLHSAMEARIEAMNHQALLLSTLRRGCGGRESREPEFMARTVGAIYARGHDVDWREYYPIAGVPIPLPAYPFQRKTYRFSSQKKVRGQRVSPLLTRCEPLPGAPNCYRFSCDDELHHLLVQHVIQGRALIPGTALLEMAYTVAALNLKRPALTQIVFSEPLDVEHHAPELFLQVDQQVRFVTKPDFESDSPWQLHAECCFEEGVEQDRTIDVGLLKQSFPQAVDPAQIYQDFNTYGLNYGPDFRGLKDVYLGSGCAMARIAVPNDAPEFHLHPVLADMALQTLQVAVSSGVVIPLSLERFEILRPPETDIHVLVHLVSEDKALIHADAELFSEDGRLVAVYRGIRCKRMDAGLMQQDCYRVTWNAAEMPPKPAIRSQRLVFRTACVDFELAHELGSATILLGETWREEQGTPVEICAANPNHFARLVSVVPNAQWVFYFDSKLEESETLRGLKRAFDCAKALASLENPPVIRLVTRYAQATLNASRLNPGNAAIWGLFRSLAEELPNVDFRAIDVHGSEYAGLADLLDATDGDDESVFHDGCRFVPRLRPAITKQNTIEPEQRPILITGGLGGLGLEIAEACLNQGCSNLVLVARSEPKEPAMSRLQKWRANGAVVRTFSCDIADASAVDQLAEKIGPVGGIIHLAGVVSDTRLQNMHHKDVDRVLAPKVFGAQNLRRAFAKKDNLSFFVMFSSVTALLRAPGQGNYAAANAYLDAFAYNLRQEGIRASSIAWGPWAEVGMAAKRRPPAGIHAFSPKRGQQLFSREYEASYTLVMAVDWPVFLGRFNRIPGLLSEFKTTTKQVPVPSIDLSSLPPKRAAEVVLRQVGDLTAQVLDTEFAPSAEARLFEIGLDSLMAMELRNRMQSVFDLKLPATLVFDYPSIGALADYMYKALEINQIEVPAEPETVMYSHDELDELLRLELEQVDVLIKESL